MRGALLVALTVGLAASISTAEISLVLLAAWLVLRPRPVGTPRAVWPLVGPLVVFAAWTLVAALASARPGESVVASKGLLALGALWIVANALPDRRAARRFMTGLLIAVSVVAALAIVQVGFCPAAGTIDSSSWPVRLVFRKCARARGFFSIYMTLAGVLTLVLVSTLPRLPRAGAAALWMFPAWVAGVVALGLTYVRGAWLAFAVAAAGCALAFRHRWLVLSSLALLVAGTLAVQPGVRERLRTLGDPRDDTTRDRLAMIDTGLRLLRAHPITGVGPGQVKHVYPTWAGEEALRRSTSHLHNTPLQIAVERGLPGLAAWLAIWVAFFGRAVRTVRRLPAGDEEARRLVLGPMAACAAFLVGGLFEYNFGDTEVLLVALSLMGLPFVVERDLPHDAEGVRAQ